MFQVVEWHFEVIFFLLASTKFDFPEVNKAMFQVVARHCELIFSLLTGLKYDLGEVEKRYFKGSHGTFISFTACGPAQNATWVK